MPQWSRLGGAVPRIESCAWPQAIRDVSPTPSHQINPMILAIETKIRRQLKGLGKNFEDPKMVNFYIELFYNKNKMLYFLNYHFFTSIECVTFNDFLNVAFECVFLQ